MHIVRIVFAIGIILVSAKIGVSISGLDCIIQWCNGVLAGIFASVVLLSGSK